MTQAEKLLARIQTLEPSGLYEIVVYITPEKTIGFWMVQKQGKTEGETKPISQKEAEKGMNL